MFNNDIVTICACASRSFINKDKVTEVAAILQEYGFQTRIEADLCRKAMQSSPDLQDMAKGTIIACYPRAIRSHFDRLDIETGTVIDIRNGSIDEILSQLGISYPDTDLTFGKEAFRKMIADFTVENGTDAWYPVIDKERCTECGRCHDFCLFGVYSIENKKVKAVNPQNCKNNCPACAHMCPNRAIIFPKYEKSPVNGGILPEEIFNPEEMDQMYHERLRMRLQQRRAGISLLKGNNK